MLLCKILLLAEIVKSNDAETEDSDNCELFTYFFVVSGTLLVPPWLPYLIFNEERTKTPIWSG